MIVLREGLEASLIISIILAFLGRMGRKDQFRSIWLGTGLALLASLAAGDIIFLTVGGLEGRAEEIFEGLAVFLAVGVLSYMVLWMRRQARHIKAHLETQVKEVLMAGSALALASLAFVVVVREGIEMVLFLFSASRSAEPGAILWGGLLGLALVAGIGYAGYWGSRRLNLPLFFNITGVLLILFAAGLLAHGIHEFQEAGVFPVVREEVWNTNGVLNEKTGVGAFLQALFGYNGNPELLEVLFHFSYLTATPAFFFRPEKPRPARASPTRGVGFPPGGPAPEAEK